MYCGDDNYDHQDKDMYTLAAEAIVERNNLRERLRIKCEHFKEICEIDDVGRISHDLEITKGHVEYYRRYTEQLLEERAMLRRALLMIKRISRLCGTPWFVPTKTIEKLVIGVFFGDFDD